MIATVFIALAALSVSIVFFGITFSFPSLSSDPGGLALVPRIACVATGVASVVLLLREASQADYLRSLGERFRQSVGVWSSVHADDTKILARRVVYVCALSALYPNAILSLGFLLGTFIFSLSLLLLYRGRLLKSCIFAAIVATAAHLFFAQLLGAFVPPGDWMGPVYDVLGID